MELRRTEHYPTTVDGWSLHLTRYVAREFDPSLPPVVLIPGYGMNSFVLSFHPRGTSMVKTLALAGHEVWTADLRGQGRSRATQRRAGRVTLRNLALNDLQVAIATSLRATQTRHERVVLVGASLGGTLSYAHLALRPRARVAGVVAIGAPLRWVKVAPIVKLAFLSPRVLGLVPMRGTRKIARVAMPIAARFPQLATMYANAGRIDMSYAAEMTKTVENPTSALNVELARWMKRGDLFLAGVEVSHVLQREERPLLVIHANRDGIVPAATASSAGDIWGGPSDVIKVGDRSDWYAHADLFVGDDCARDVFAPMVAWLRELRV